jgi:GNAT superfamily N-acetyltransferase
MDVRRLTEADVDAAMDLSTQAGWNQIGADWRRLVSLAPERCYAGWVDGELVATTTAMTYGDELCWIGMVLVDEDHRRRGYGTRLLEHALEAARDDVTAGVGLDATGQGRPLYRQQGFADVCPITRLSGTLDRTDPPGDIEVITETAPAAVATFDANACGTDRTALLERLLSEPGTAGVVSREGGEPDGYAILRPGRQHWQLGPIVADDADVLASLLDGAAARLEGDDVIVDSLARGRAAELLVERGLDPQRHLTRMTSPETLPLLSGERVVAAAGLELG